MALQDTRETGSEQRVQLRSTLAVLLPGVRPDSLDALAQLAHFRTRGPGEMIYHQGEPVPLTFIVCGHAILQRTTMDGHRLMSGVAGAPILFGYSAIAGTASSVEVVALTTCEVVQWPGPELRAIVRRDPDLALLAIDSLASSLHVVMEHIEGYMHQDARRRVVRILARYRDLFFGKPPILDRRHLPGLVGTTREMTGRVLRQLEREGTLARVGRTGLALLRPDGLDVEVDRRPRTN